ncbi:MAG: ABC transporter ATP-binding protein [Clostridia bacterium]|nr:ABC transporter ATP-binding protein [Clostridia bacterium]
MSKSDVADVPLGKTQKETIPDYDWLFNEDSDRDRKKSRFLSKIIKINIKPILLSLFIYLFQSLPVYMIPLCTADIINTVTGSISTGVTDAVWLRIGINVAIVLFCIILNVPSTVLRWKVASKMLRRTSAGIRMALVRKLQSLSITYHKDMQTGKIQAKFLRDMDTLDSFFSTMIHGFLLHVITLIIYVVIAVIKNGWVSLFFLLIVPFNVLLRNAFYKKIRAVNRDYRVNAEGMSAKLTSMMEMIPVTKSHGLESEEIYSVQNTVQKVEKSGIKMDKTIANFGAWSFVVNNVLSIMCLTFCAVLCLNGVGGMQVGDIVLFQSMFTQISSAVSALVNSMPQIYAGREAVDSISELMNSSDVERNIGKPTVPTIKGEIQFNNVNYKYPNTDQLVIKDFSLDVKAGECIAVVGPSGSGKSTLINMIIGFLPPTSGTVKIDGKDMSGINLSEYRHHISVVPQNSILFSGTIKENITYGLSHYSEQDLEKVLEMANINEFLAELPQGINTVVGEHGDKLSGGQRQRISIARALIRNPQILILDEATSALDNISEYHVQKAISTSIQGRTTFIVAHRLSTIRNADRILVMENGECVESGTYEELIAKKGKFFELKNLNDMTSKKVEADMDKLA